MDINLSGRHAIVCGGTSGIGKSIALELAALGAEVTLVARNQEKLESLVRQLPVKNQQSHTWVQADFSYPEELKKAIHQHLETLDRVDILVNNTAGPSPGLAMDAAVTELQEAFNKHLVCNQILVQAIVPKMKRNQYGRIINIISTSVKEPIPGLGVSNTVRGAVANWAKTLSKELGQFGITVNNILPGSTSTQRIYDLIANRAKKQNKSEAEIEEEMKKAIPIGRFADPKEMAYAAAFLASPSAAYISGVNLPVDGGRLGCG